MKSKPFIVLMLLFLCACPAIGAIHFNDGLTHDIDYYIYDSVRVDYETPYMYTTVNLLYGAQLRTALVGYENSRLNVYGGSVNTINSSDSSLLNISGGSIDHVYSSDSSQVSIFSGKINDYLWSIDSSQIDISGGWLESIHSFMSSQLNISGGGIELLRSYNSSQLNITGGLIERYLFSYDHSRVDISGGEILSLVSHDSSQVDIIGGSIGHLILFEQSNMQIFGYDFAVNGQPFGYGELSGISGQLTGTLLSGELIDCDFRIGNDARIILIPEPATVLLLGLGGLALRRKCRT